jgi:hypothetical protein
MCEEGVRQTCALADFHNTAEPVGSVASPRFLNVLAVQVSSGPPSDSDRTETAHPRKGVE